MKKLLLILFCGCMLNFTAFADVGNAAQPTATLTGSQGDAGDPSNAVITTAANNAPNVGAQMQAQAQTQPQMQTAPAPTSPQSVLTAQQQVLQGPVPANNSPNTIPVQTVDPQDPSTMPMQEQTPPQPAPDNPNALGSTSVGRAAFVDVVHNLMPLNPQQIKTLRGMFDQSQQAVAQYPGTPPKPTSSSILVSMSPGSTPPVIRLRAGYVTSLVFLDSTGQPWPVVGYDLGNPKAFNIQPSAPDGKSATLIVQSLVRYEQGNLAVMLKDESTPVMLTLMPGQRAVDYRVDLRIPGLGPNASIATIGLPQAANPVLLSFLDGVTPQGARLLSVAGAPAQAWAFRGRLFLRTRVTILSPGWLATMSSPDGTHVYELAKTPIVLASQRGAMVQLSIKGL